jgi:hypothetical protein
MFRRGVCLAWFDVSTRIARCESHQEKPKVWIGDCIGRGLDARRAVAKQRLRIPHPRAWFFPRPATHVQVSEVARPSSPAAREIPPAADSVPVSFGQNLLLPLRVFLRDVGGGAARRLEKFRDPTGIEPSRIGVPELAGDFQPSVANPKVETAARDFAPIVAQLARACGDRLPSFRFDGVEKVKVRHSAPLKFFHPSVDWFAPPFAKSTREPLLVFHNVIGPSRWIGVISESGHREPVTLGGEKRESGPSPTGIGLIHDRRRVSARRRISVRCVKENAHPAPVSNEASVRSRDPLEIRKRDCVARRQKERPHLSLWEIALFVAECAND